MRAKWSGAIDGLWLAFLHAKVRHLCAGSSLARGVMPTVWVTECGVHHTSLTVVNGERYDRLPPCRHCLHRIADTVTYWQGILEQQGAA